MAEIKLSDLDSLLRRLDYPVNREDVAAEVGDVTLLLADGDRRLRDVLDELGTDSFENRDDLENEIYSHLPQEALGEPGQSEGDA